MVKIKSLIEYYYNIKIIDLYKKHKQYKFKCNNREYLFLPLMRYTKEIIEINNLINDKDNYDQLVYNIDNKLITLVNNQYYVLIKKTLKNIEIENEIKNFVSIYLPTDFFQTINRSNWIFLWSKKIDYIEYQQHHLGIEYPLLRNSVNYFIGMGENAISYIYDTYKLYNDSNNLVISHKRIKKKDFNNPMNLIVDYRSRDIAEYLKYLFFIGNYDYVKVKKFIDDLHLNQFSSRLIYGRMLFPTYYFDKYDKIISNEEEEKKILEILKKVDEYEDFLVNIYMILNHDNIVIDKINWL